jgi:hypothetical protein
VVQKGREGGGEGCRRGSRVMEKGRRGVVGGGWVVEMGRERVLGRAEGKGRYLPPLVVHASPPSALDGRFADPSRPPALRGPLLAYVACGWCPGVPGDVRVTFVVFGRRPGFLVAFGGLGTSSSRSPVSGASSSRAVAVFVVDVAVHDPMHLPGLPVTLR